MHGSEAKDRRIYTTDSADSKPKIKMTYTISVMKLEEQLNLLAWLSPKQREKVLGKRRSFKRACASSRQATPFFSALSIRTWWKEEWREV